MKLTIIVLLVCLALVSCKKEQSENIIDENFCKEELEIIIDGSRILIDIENSIASIKTKRLINENYVVENISFNLTEIERQKLFSNAYKLITLTDYTIYTKSCYAGQNFTLRLICDTKALEFHQSSVANWSKISKETMEIYSILQAKTDLKE